MKHIFAALISGCILFPAQAQTTPTDMQWKSELQVEQEYHPTIKEAQKISFSPEINKPKAPSEKEIELSDYSIKCPITLEFQEPNLNNFFTEEKSMAKKGYLNVGISTAIHTNMELGYRILASEKIQWNILNNYEWNNENRFLCRPQENDSIKKKKIGDYLFATDYRQHFKGLTLTADAQYFRSAFNYPNTIEKQVHLFTLHAGIMSEERKEMNYELHLNYDMFNVLNDKKSYYADLGFNLHAIPDFMDQIGFSGKLKSADFNNSTVTVHPYGILKGKNWKADMGFEINVSFGKSGPFFIAPKLSLHWNPKEAAALHASIQGGITNNRNSLSFFETRYLKPRTRLFDSKSYDATLYSDLRLFSPLLWHVLLGYQWIWDEHFFCPEDYYLNAMYMHGNVLKVGTSLQYAFKDFLQFQVKGTYYQWSRLKWSENNQDMSKPEHLYPCNRPSFVGDIDIYFHMKTLPLAWNVQYQPIIGKKKTREGFLNIHYASLHAVYQLKDWISISASLNNLFFQKYDFWHDYPIQNFNLTCGANLKF